MKKAELKLKRGEDIYLCSQKLLLMVRELHCLGFEKLRIIPHIAPSGLYWRCEFVPKKYILKNIGTKKSQKAAKYVFPFYTSGMEFNYFEWEDGKNLSSFEMAERFADKFPELMEDCRGEDKKYAKWFLKVLATLTESDLPFFSNDSFDAYSYVPTTKGNLLEMPPKGEAEK
ncbi:MAG: hypothetical protein FWD66_07810 [Paludibacter sp.]|nr:hypothetical protein [Paludibacter sp.]